MRNAALRPVTLLIAALGGEGGGVLTEWVVRAAASQGFPVQSTSIPGVAQRTGATTYYIEILPLDASVLAGRVPVLALTPGIGDIDVMVASELLEAARAVASGFVTPDRTLLIASTQRIYAMNEKIAMGDGRLDSGRLLRAIEQNARANLLLDMEEIASAAGAMLNAVLLGALAGSGALPIPEEAFAAAIRADGKAVEANLRGFRAGFEAARGGTANVPRRDGKRRRPSVPSLANLEREITATFPEAAREVAVEGARRLAAYQDRAYARLYLDRLVPIAAADARAAAGGRLLCETARHLALRMSFEDVIRVAQAKLDPARIARIAAESGAKPGEPIAIVDFFKPGIEELCSVLPSALARPILALAERRGWLGKIYWGMELSGATVSGHLRLRLLASLKRFRKSSHRFRAEQIAIEEWLGLIAAAAELSGDLALEVAECARLIKGYGDTIKRGIANYRTIEQRLIRPALAPRLDLGRAIDAIASARTAALADPEGESLAKTLAEIEASAVLSAAAE
jgi:indolepyruvate ferredoxin oxidoreductase, beta subunit